MVPVAPVALPKAVPPSRASPAGVPAPRHECATLQVKFGDDLMAVYVCDPDGVWREMVPDDMLQASSSMLRDTRSAYLRAIRSGEVPPHRCTADAVRQELTWWHLGTFCRVFEAAASAAEGGYSDCDNEEEDYGASDDSDYDDDDDDGSSGSDSE